MIKFVTSDKAEHSADAATASQSVLIKNLLEDLGDEPSAAIPLPNVTGPIFEKVLVFCAKHQNDAPQDAENKSDEISAWDREFAAVDQSTLFELILAANYLDIKPLLDLGCKTVANMIKGKSVEEIRTTFNIVNDFTPEEEEQIRKENEWAEG